MLVSPYNQGTVVVLPDSVYLETLIHILFPDKHWQRFSVMRERKRAEKME